MPESEIDTLQNIHEALVGTQATPVAHIENPVLEVEKSLTSFLKHRLSKLQENAQFEDQIKDAILQRLGEATIGQLSQLLEAVQRNSNTATEKVLAPFISQNGAPSPLLPDKGFREQEEQRIFEGEGVTKDVLQGAHALHQLIDLLTEASSSGTPEGSVPSPEKSVDSVS